MDMLNNTNRTINVYAIDSSKSIDSLTLDVIKYNRTIAHIYNVNTLTLERVISLLSYGYTLKPRE
jgi:hypothetical protein